MLPGQLPAIVSTILIFLVNALLALLLTRYYIQDKKNVSYLLWSAGLRFFAIAVILEILFAFGVYSDFLVKVYLFTIAMPLLAFSLGHIQFVKSERIKKYYYYYCIAFAFFLLYALYTSNVSNLLTNYVVYGRLPQLVYLGSSILTLSASAVLFLVAFGLYSKRKEKLFLAIIPGVIVFWVANIIHIEISQLFIYYLDLLAIIFIWLALVGFTKIRKMQSVNSGNPS